MRATRSEPHPNHVELPSARGGDPRAARARARPIGLVGWLMPPTMLAATACGIALVLRGPDRIFGVTAAALFGLAMLWILISVFFPARADRTCPACGDAALQRLDPETTRGVLCAACGHVDAEHSSFLLAEEEGPIERLVLVERARRAAHAERAPEVVPQDASDPSA